MIIEEKDFRLTPVKDSGDRFDLELLKIINKGKKTERKEFKNIAYGITIESAIRYIVNYRISSNCSGTIDLKAYFEEYKKELNSLKELLCEG